MKFSLLVLTHCKQEGQVLEIKLPQFLVGRDPQCHLRPASPLISKRHCVLIQRDGKAFIRDFDSTNGTFVNDQPVKGERELFHDDQLKIGPISFAVRLEPDPLPKARTPAPISKPVTKLPSPQAPVGKAVEQPISEKAPAEKIPAEKTPAVKTPAPKTPAKIPAAKTPPAEKTRVPAVAASKGSSTEDAIAAMMLSVEGDDAPEPTAVDSAGVPTGSTVLDLKALNDTKTETKVETPKKEDKKPKPAKDTQNAAAALLAKMTRRPRS
jgi:pSer/pThr/pTyr-binding forkhead associated (FHA) protein